MMYSVARKRSCSGHSSSPASTPTRLEATERQTAGVRQMGVGLPTSRSRGERRPLSLLMATRQAPRARMADVHSRPSPAGSPTPSLPSSITTNALHRIAMAPRVEVPTLATPRPIPRQAQ